MILILSQAFDFSTNFVMQILQNSGYKVLRINGDEDIYQFIKLDKSGVYFKNRETNQQVNLSNATVCWWRRLGITSKLLMPNPQESLVVDNFDLSTLVRGNKNLLEEEGKSLINYIHSKIYETIPRHLGKPGSNLNRLVTLDIAEKKGFKVPSYEIITTGVQLGESRHTLGTSVTKAVANGVYDLLGNHRFYTYTELIELDFYEQNQSNIFFPSLITGLIEKKFEVRSFYLSGVFYSMAIFSQTNEQTKIDFRKYSNNRTEPYQLPKHIEKKLESVFKEIGLNCGSADLIVDQKNDFVFLEINPVGQFDMTSRPCNYNLHQKVANYLTYEQ